VPNTFFLKFAGATFQQEPLVEIALHVGLDDVEIARVRGKGFGSHRENRAVVGQRLVAKSEELHHHAPSREPEIQRLPLKREISKAQSHRSVSIVEHRLIEVAGCDGVQQHAGEYRGRLVPMIGFAVELGVQLSGHVGDDWHLAKALQGIMPRYRPSGTSSSALQPDFLM
jgi:hypothetical protein